MENTAKPQASVIPKGVTWIKDYAVKIDPDNNQVTVQKGDVFTYDYLVVCPGITIDWDKIKGLREYLGKNGVTTNYTKDTAPYTWELINNFKGVQPSSLFRLVLSNAQAPPNHVHGR